MNEIVRTDLARPPAANDDRPTGMAHEAPRRIEVRPDEVFQDEPVRPVPWRQHSFFAPVLLVLLVSAGFLYGAIGLATLVWSWWR